MVVAGAKDRGAAVRGLCLPGGASASRKRLDELTETAKLYGAKGMVWMIAISIPLLMILGIILSALWKR